MAAQGEEDDHGHRNGRDGQDAERGLPATADGAGWYRRTLRRTPDG